MILVRLLLGAPLACYPQTTEVDQITGTIQDTSGAAVPNTEIDVRTIRPDIKHSEQRSHHADFS
jgi:hypothetical protein